MSAQIERYCLTARDEIRDLGIGQKRMSTELEDTYRSVQALGYAVKRRKTETDMIDEGKPS